MTTKRKTPKAVRAWGLVSASGKRVAPYAWKDRADAHYTVGRAVKKMRVIRVTIVPDMPKRKRRVKR